MSLGCARCGDCCESIAITSTTGDITAKLAHPRLAGGVAREAAFIARNMTPTGEVMRVGNQVRQVWTCGKFDPVERICTAHDERPRMCSGYPWYGNEPGPDRIMEKETRCSFWLDVPAADRPAGVRPLIPLEVL